MKKILFALSATFCIGFYSCKTDKTKTTETSKERVIAKKTDAQVKTEMDQLSKELDQAWNTMIASDDQKIENMRILHTRLKEKSLEKQAMAEVDAARDNLKVKRYDRQAIADIAAVDSYDSAQVQLMDKTYDLAESNNLAIRDTVVANLVNQIREDDNRVVFFRARYDRAAKNYNQFLHDYQAQLQKLGPPYNELKPAPMFTPQPVLQ